MPVTVTIKQWRVTSGRPLPDSVTSVTAPLMPSPDIVATPIYEERIAVQVHRAAVTRLLGYRAQGSRWGAMLSSRPRVVSR